MMRNRRHWNKESGTRTVHGGRGFVFCVFMFLLFAWPAAMVGLQQPAEAVAPRMTGRYHFLGPEDTVAILQEGTLLKGFIDVYPGEEESDAILSYNITIGSRKGNQVDFKTQKIHEVYYRFSGDVGRGEGKKLSDPDYLRLTGTLETVTMNSVTGTQKTVKQSVVFKSIPRGQGPPD
ncbi:MAG: hypothetical protein KGM47_01100 [Acidobacteriota bacterium]|nr:hypothetical protein [Acidobacteriota bacterium]